MHLRDGKSISEIARLTSLLRNTIKKWLRSTQGAGPRYQRRDGPTKLAPFTAALRAIKGGACTKWRVGMRGLQPRELYRAQGFPDTYVIDRGADGPLPKDAQVRKCGSAGVGRHGGQASRGATG
jgi:hypothetical protein